VTIFIQLFTSALQNLAWSSPSKVVVLGLKVRVEIDASVTTGCEALVFGVAVMPVLPYETAV